jgi:diguanylate cyclase (GGDEF)-like protein
MQFNQLFKPKDFDCEQSWIKCHKFSTFLKLLFIAIIIVLIFAVVRFVQGEILIAKINLTGALLFSSFFYILIKYNNTYDFLSRLFLLIVFLMATLSFSIAEQGSRAVWLASIVVAAFYFRDGKEGLIWTAIFASITLIKEYFNFLNDTPLKFVDTATLIANFILISLVLTWYEIIKSREQKRLKEQNELLETMVEKRTKELEIMSHTDELTGLYNRRYLYEVIQHLLPFQKRGEKSFIFIMIDIDFFKQYNDRYGHQMGDDVLKKISLVIKNNLLRGTDYAFRLGGEEFGVIMTDMSKDEVFIHAEKMREDIFELGIEHKGSDIDNVLTASFGIEYLIPGKESNFDEIYKCADQKLYKAKSLGRNQVVF